MKRPALKIGDVVRLSKRGKSQRSMFSTYVMVVEKFSGDSSDGRTRIECSTFLDGHFMGKAAFKRRDLWSTGYNSMSKTVNQNNVITQKITRDDLMQVPIGISSAPMTTNDGRTHCMKCKQATKFVPGFGSGGYNLCKNKACTMFDR